MQNDNTSESRRFPSGRGHAFDGEGLPLAAVAERENMQPGQAGSIRHQGMQKLRHDWRLRRLADDALCYQHVGARAFRSTWTSSTEAAALRLLGER